MKLFCLTIFLCLSLCNVMQAQTKETVTNKSIIDLTKAGFDSNLIASKIETSDCKFDLTTNALIALKKEKVSPYVISVMMSKSNGSAVPAARTQVASQPASLVKSQNAEKVRSGSVPEPDIINLIHYYDKSKSQITPLERASANMRTRTKMLGYGGADMTFEVPGEKSPVRVPKADALSFIVNSGGGVADGFVLYKVEVKNKTRRAVAMNISSFEGAKGSKGIVVVNIKMLKQGIYELMPAAILEPGEYFFANKGVTNAATSNVDVYAFGVD